MSEIAAYIDSLPDIAEEVDLSTFEHIEEFDDETWHKLDCLRWEMKILKLPSALITIQYQAFYTCIQLMHVTLPSSLRIIGNEAFYDCEGLVMRDLKLPASIEDLGRSAFIGCSGLTGKLTTHITAHSSFSNCSGLTALGLANCK
jgi:hypothetical protein